MVIHCLNPAILQYIVLYTMYYFVVTPVLLRCHIYTCHIMTMAHITQFVLYIVKFLFSFIWYCFQIIVIIDNHIYSNIDFIVY